MPDVTVPPNGPAPVRSSSVRRLRVPAWLRRAPARAPEAPASAGRRGPAAAGRYLRRWVADWLNERARMPGVVLGAIVLALMPQFHLALGTTLLIEFVIGKIPVVNSMIQAIRIHQFKRWSRPGSYQDPTVATVEGAPEVKQTWREMRWQRVLARAAERPGPVGKFCQWVDDWLNERYRIPSFVVDAVTFSAGFLGGLPTALVFILDWVVGRAPAVNSFCLAVANRSVRRFNRPGSFQHSAGRPGAHRGQPDVSAPATPAAAAPAPPGRRAGVTLALPPVAPGRTGPQIEI